MIPRHSRVLILGSGPAGYTAAVYAARAMLAPVLIQGIQPGGQLTITTDVENYPGFAERRPGPLADGADAAPGRAYGRGDRQRPHRRRRSQASARSVCQGDSGVAYTGDALIIATGAQARWLGLDSEHRFKGFGVSACATCDGFFFRGKNVVVVGGGNTAVEEALFLTKFATSVTILHRREALPRRKDPAEADYLQIQRSKFSGIPCSKRLLVQAIPRW